MSSGQPRVHGNGSVEAVLMSTRNLCFGEIRKRCTPFNKKVQVGKDQEKAQSEKDSHSKNRGGKKPN